MMTASPFLKKGAFTRKKFNQILLATTLAWLVSFIDGCADSLLAGILLNETAVSAVELVQPMSSVISFFAFLVSVGTVAMFSRESGAFRKEEAYQTVGQGFICSLGISVFLVIAMLLVREPYLRYYQASQEITAMARSYYTCEIFFAAVYPTYYIIYQLVVIDGDEVCGFIASLISAVVNILASLILAGLCGISGLAIGSIIGCFAGMLAYSSHFLRKTNSVHLRLHFNFREVCTVLKTGSATAMTLLYVALIDIVMNRFVIAKFGDGYLPAYAVVNFVLNMGAVFAGLYDACSGFVGVGYGENNPAGIRQTMKIAVRGLIVVSALMIVLMELVAPSVADLYGITDPAVRTAAVYAARVIPLTYPVLAVYYLFGSYYPLIGRVWLSHILSGIYMLISPLALAIPMSFAFGFNGLSIGFMLTCVVAVLITAVVVRIAYGKKAVPLILPETKEEAIFYDLYLTESNISALCEKVKAELEARKVAPSIINEVQLILEESYMTILEENAGEKIMTECNLLISDSLLRVITRDNGKIFNVTDANAEVKSFRSYVLAEFMERNARRTNTTTISFNRNSYFWQLK